VHYPVDEAYAPFYMIRRYVILAILAGTIIFLVMVWTVMRRFMRPLTMIARHMEETPSKTAGQKLLNIISEDEIGTLSLA